MKRTFILTTWTIHFVILSMIDIDLCAQNRRTSSTYKPVKKSSTKSNSTSNPTEVVEPTKKDLPNFSGLSKWSLQIELGANPISSANSKTILTYQGSLGIDYNLASNLRLGLFGQTMLYHQNLDVANIDSKIIDLSSIEYNTLGMRANYKILLSKFYVSPQVDLGYSFFISKAIDYDQDKKAFLDYRYITLAPKLALGYQLSESFHLGIFGGYSYQMTALKGKKIEEFNPNGIMGGLVVHVNIQR